MDAKKEAGKIFSDARKEYRRKYYQENRDRLLAKQNAYRESHKAEINLKNRIKRMENRECYWCHKHFDRPGDIYKYKKHYFCDDTCLGEYLVSKAEDDIEVVWNDTEENIRICALEAKGEY